MKRAKIMLLTIAVVATVGTALAFKVNKLGTTTYCYAETTSEPQNCEEKTRANATVQSGTGIFYTVKGSAIKCTSLECPDQGGSFAQ